MDLDDGKMGDIIRRVKNEDDSEGKGLIKRDIELGSLMCYENWIMSSKITTRRRRRWEAWRLEFTDGRYQ